MKKSLFLFPLVLLLVLGIMNFVSASTTVSCNLNVSLINQNPYPAIPDSYVKIVFQLGGVYNSQCRGAWFELIPKYPFSLDENDTIKILEDNTYVSGYKMDWMIPYQLRVDKNALDGSPEVEVHYRAGAWDSDSYITKRFNITVQDSRTNFDAVLQEVSGSDVSIAIANTGKYTANSVVVRIPEQESFRATATDGQMVGNLESGDYTIVGFSISQKGTFSRNMSRTNPQQNSASSNKLKFDIYYTDNIGERRVVNMELPLNMGNSTALGNFAGRRTAQTSSSGPNWYAIIIILAVLAGAYFIYRKYPKNVKNFLNRANKKELLHDETPDWIKNARQKEKK